jgi:pseudouridine-5'-phosphate glycosidase
VVLARGGLGATTVSGTLIGARAAGIRVFATGGIGGVHRGVADTWDISADIPELAQSPVAVVSAGAKSILDLPKTLEALETAGVPVLGYRTDEFPAFFSRRSGCALEHRVESPGEVADILRAHWGMGLTGGVLVAQPLPESEALDEGEMERAIAVALADAGRQGVSGKALTPFLLAALRGARGGASLAANLTLVEQNAALAGEIAQALAGAAVS